MEGWSRGRGLRSIGAVRLAGRQKYSGCCPGETTTILPALDGGACFRYVTLVVAVVAASRAEGAETVTY